MVVKGRAGRTDHKEASVDVGPEEMTSGCLEVEEGSGFGRVDTARRGRPKWEAHGEGRLRSLVKGRQQGPDSPAACWKGSSQTDASPFSLIVNYFSGFISK